jgi:hypothetical protein
LEPGAGFLIRRGTPPTAERPHAGLLAELPALPVRLDQQMAELRRRTLV